MARLVGINHIAVEVGNVEEAVALFERVFEGVEQRGRVRGMAFLDLGDQFIALAETIEQPPDRHRHIGLVVDDVRDAVGRLREAGVEIIGDHDFRDPWGNRWQLVDYREIQFTKAPRVLQGMGLQGIAKSERALEELRSKGLAD